MNSCHVRGSTRILGIFGDPVEHSLSPLMQNAALQAARIDAVYVPFHVRPAQLPSAVEALRLLNIWGINVTIPHKEAICAYLDRIDPEARLMGAVNTVVNRDGKLIGYNTDGVGLVKSLAEDLSFNPRGKRILLLGAGGACRAALAALAKGGADWLGIANRSPQRSVELASRFSEVLPGTTFAPFSLGTGDLASVLGRVDLLVNTSSVGLKGEAFLDFPWDSIPSTVPVYDMVYKRNGTPLLQTAGARGHRTADGLGILACQGEEAFRLWTGVEPPPGLMKTQLLLEAGIPPGP